jgi:hypothetical protein
MHVELQDGRCRECGGQLTIIDADDASMTVECDCGEVYLVETDAFGDGAMHYHLHFLMNKETSSDPPD